MMPTQKALSTSAVSSNDPKGRKATDLFRVAYDKVGLDDERAQRINESAEFSAALEKLITDQSYQNELLTWEREPFILPSINGFLIEPYFHQVHKKNLWLSDGNRERLLRARRFAAHARKRRFAVAVVRNTEKNTYDVHVRERLPRDHYSELGDLVSFLEKFPRGVEGVRRQFNFYVQAPGDLMVVHLQWYVSDERWKMDVLDCNQSGWYNDPGTRILYPAEKYWP